MASQRRPQKRDITDLTGLRVGLYVRVSLDTDGTEKSTDDQEADGLAWADRAQAVVAEVYRDSNRSASRFAKRQRESFARLLSDIEAGKLDAIWFWELSRSQRRLGVFADLRDLCREHSVLWVIRDRVYDPTAYADMMTLGMLSVVGENESEMTSERVKRGHRHSRLAGRPPGSAPYGYLRRYDPATRQLIAQEPNVWDGNGKPVEDSPAYVMREIYSRLAAGDSLYNVARDLNGRGIPTPGAHYRKPPGRARTQGWRASKIRELVLRPAYIGRVVYQGEVLGDVTAQWPALVDGDVWWTVYRKFTDPARKRTRPARAVSLLGWLITCDVCDQPLSFSTGGKKGRSKSLIYKCSGRGCTGINQAKLDDYVSEVMIRYLSRPDVFAELTKVNDSAVARQAHAEASELRAELDQLYRDAEALDVSPVILTKRERALKSRIDEADRRAHEATMPPVLVGSIGPEAEAKWANATINVKRQMISAVADIRLKPTGMNGAQARWHGPTVDERVSWRWLLGPGSEGDDAMPQPE